MSPFVDRYDSGLGVGRVLRPRHPERSRPGPGRSCPHDLPLLPARANLRRPFRARQTVSRLLGGENRTVSGDGGVNVSAAHLLWGENRKVAGNGSIGC